MDSINDLRLVLRENDVPYFSTEELEFYLKENNGDYNATAYQCLIIKAENTTLNVSGLSLADTSAYFRRLASRYRPYNSGVLKGGV